jgi:hypothetical protein
MNERLKQLMLEAGYAAPEIAGRANKLADLIVQECIGIVQKRYMGDNNREDMEVRRCAEALQKHFGVEE